MHDEIPDGAYVLLAGSEIWFIQVYPNMCTSKPNFNNFRFKEEFTK